MATGTPRFRRRIRSRLAMSLLLCGALFAGLSHLGVQRSVAPRLEETLAERGETLLSAVHYAAETFDEPSALQRFVSALAAEPGVRQLGVVAGSPPRIVACNRSAWRDGPVDLLPGSLGESVAIAIATGEPVRHGVFDRDEDHCDLVVPIRHSQVELGAGHGRGVVFARLDTVPMHRSVASTTRTASMISAVAFFLFGILALLLLDWRVLAPLRGLGTVMDRRTEGEDDVFVPVESTDELGRLGWQLNTMLGAHDAALERADRTSRSKSEFLANMSHEIRTPMTAILGFTDDLIESSEKGSEVQRSALTVQRNCRHLLGLLDDILDVSKIEAGRIEIEAVAVELPQLLVDAHRLMSSKAQESGIELRLRFATPIPRVVTTDPTRVKQILLNLTGNAVKFTEAGHVEIRVTVLEGDATPLVRVDVEDTGIGMTPSQLERIFAPFSQADASTARRYGGTGLGLTISRALAELLGGRLDVTSEPGVGSTFTFEVPVVFDPQIPHVARPEDVRGSSVLPKKRAEIPDLGLRVLLAEDGLDNQILIGRLLERARCEVTIVENGERAVGAVMEADPPFDVVLMDMQMPVMDGYTATRTLRGRGFDIPVIALTAHVMTGDRKRCLEAGCTGYATKPIDRDAFFAEIRTHAAEVLANRSLTT